MRLLCFTGLLAFTCIVHAQTTAISDPHFEQALIDLGFDWGEPDGMAQNLFLESIIMLDIPNLGIEDLTVPDYGDAGDVRAGETPVYWACGVTPQAAIAAARPPLCITHAPGCMLVSDLPSTTPPKVDASLLSFVDSNL